MYKYINKYKIKKRKNLKTMYCAVFQDVQRRNSLSPRGPPKNIYKNF